MEDARERRREREAARREAEIYNSGPNEELCRVSGPMNQDGWYEIDLELMKTNIAFMSSRDVIRAVQDVTSNALFNGNVLFAHSDKPSKEDPFIVHQRSDMWKRWLVQVKNLRDANGIVPVCAAVNDTHPAIARTDPWRPAIVNLSLVKRMRCKVSIDSKIEWELYGSGVQTGSAGIRDIDSQFLIPGVHVIVGDTPIFTSKGVMLVSRVASVRKVFELSDNKIKCEIEADRRRAFDDPVSQQVDSDHASGASRRNPHNPSQLTSGEFPASGSAAADQSCSPAEVRAYSLALKNGHVVAHETRDRMQNAEVPQTLKTRRLPEGYSLVPNFKPPEAPTDTFVSIETALNMVCQRWGVPKNMLSTGDVTGKPKLSEAGASVEMGMVFRDSQAASRKWLETEAENMHFRMYFGTHLEKMSMEWAQKQKKTESEQEEDPTKKSSKKRKAVTDPPAAEKDDEKERKIERAMHVTVSLPGTLPFTTVTSLYGLDMIRWEAARELLSRSLGVPVETFPEEAPPTEQDNELAKIKAKPAAASSGSASKKAKK